MTTASNNALAKDDADRVSAYGSEVAGFFAAKFREDGRFPDGGHMIARFKQVVGSVLQHGFSTFSGVEEAHNELCIAGALLDNVNPRFTLVEYEPRLEGGAQTIDLRAAGEGGLTAYVDVKTIQPKASDRWDQYERAKEEAWFPENVRVRLLNDWLGGELWHSMVAARSRMLEYALELEKKIRDAGLVGRGNTFAILALCGAGFHWHESELEDFVAFYRTGRHRGDDSFAKMEADYIARKRISLDRTIERFACMRRSQGHVRHARLNWNVRPPADLPF